MNGITDTFVRNSYFGGAVDCYKCYGKDLYYYDVNSLYPFAMLKPMPFNLIASYNGENCKNIKITKDATIASRAVTSLSTHACTVGQIRKMSTNCITPTTKKDLRKKLFYTMDIETISMDNGVQIPVMLTLAGRNIEKYFLADHLINAAAT